MGGFDRSKYKAVTTESAVKQQDAEQQRKRPTEFEKNYHKIEKGDNFFRIFPFHIAEGGGKTFYENKCVSYIELEVDKRDSEGNVIEGQKEMKRKPIFNSKVHGNLKKDLIEEYLGFAKDVAIPNSSDMSGAIWGKLVGVKDKKPLPTDNIIKPSDSRVIYAAKSEGVNEDGTHIWSKPKLVELNKTIQKAMTELAAEYESPDPFSDIDDGIPIKIKKWAGEQNPKDPKDWYRVSFVKTRNGKEEKYADAPISDADLEEFYKMKSLHNLYVNSFKHSDLQMQLDGLDRLDKKLAAEFPGYSVFAIPEFLDVVEELFNLVPETKEEEGEQDGPTDDEPEEKPAPKAVTKPTIVTKPLARATPPVSTPKKEVEQEVVVEADSKEERLAALRKKIGKK